MTRIQQNLSDMANSKPLAYFYDIQNLPLPPNKDPIDCIQRLREIFGTLGSEVEFIVACDVIKEKKEIIKALGYIPKASLWLDCRSPHFYFVSLLLVDITTRG